MVPRSSVYASSLFDQTDPLSGGRFGASPFGSAGLTTQDPHQGHVLHSAGMRPAMEGMYGLSSAHERNKAVSLLRQQNGLEQVKLLSWQAQNQITFLPPDKPSVAHKRLPTSTSQGNVPGWDDWERERDLMYGRAENLIKNLRQSLSNRINDNVDETAVSSLKGYIRFRYPNYPKSLSFTKQEEDRILKSDSAAHYFPPILLSDFALGKGPDHRTFTLSDKVAKEFLKEYVLKSVLDGLYKEVSKSGFGITYKEFLQRQKGRPISYGLAFSPEGNPSTWPESIRRHIDANPTQLVIGGAMIYALPSVKSGWAVIEIRNAMSRNSFLFHVADNYERNAGKDRPLSTIRQSFKFSIKIDPNKFPSEVKPFPFPTSWKPAQPQRTIRVPWK